MDPAHAPAPLLAVLLDALREETARAAGAPTEPVSISFDFLSSAPAQSEVTAHVRIDRTTRSIVFATADLTDRDARKLIAASGVYRIVGK